MDNLLAEGKAEPMLIVLVNNQVVHRNHPQHADLTFDIMEREYREAVIPFIDSHYKTIANPHGRAISGLSMGGRHTMFVGLKSLDLFANFGILSAGDNRPEETLGEFLNDPEANEKVDYLFIGQGGDEEKGMFNFRVKPFREALDKHGIEYEYFCIGVTGHDWSTWRGLLYYGFLPNLWKISRRQR
jgi:enterochelin esterase family protein